MTQNTARASLFFLGHTLPYPPDQGAHIRTFHIIRQLAVNYDITALFFFRAATHSTGAHVDAALRGLEPYARAEAFPIEQEYSRSRFVWDHLRSLANQRPYTVFAYESKAFRERLRYLLATTTFDVLHMDSLDLSAYLADVAHLPVVCVHHNVESALLERRAQMESSTLRRRYVLHQSRLLRREEQRCGTHVDLNVLVSEGDEKIFRRISPASRTVVVPNGVDTSWMEPSEAPGQGLVFVGPASWIPNRDAMQYFCEEILPLVRRRNGDLSVTWIGRVTDDLRSEFESRYGVHLTGYVDDVRPYVTEAAVYIVPLRIGGGTRLKILDAWALGVPVVSTAIGCEGLATENGANIVVADSPMAFASAISSLLNDPGRRRAIAAAARRTVEEIYDWEVIGRSMIPHYRYVHRLSNGHSA